MMKKPIFASAFGVAASIALLVALLFPGNGGPAVQAAEIIQKLNAQIQEDPLLEITLDALAIDEVFVNGHLQVASHGVAGDLQVEVSESPDQVVKIDLALGLSEDEGWVLIRDLVVPDPQAQAVLAMLFPPGSEVLLMLPDEALGAELGLDLEKDLAELHSGEIVEVFKELINSHAEYGATIEHQRDGTILLTLPIDDAEALAALEQMLKAKIVVQTGGEMPAEENISIDLDTDSELVGSTVTVVYDPTLERVQSLGIEDLGPMKGSITIGIREGGIDPALLDSSRVTGPNTRVLDLKALEGMFENLELDLDL